MDTIPFAHARPAHQAGYRRQPGHRRRQGPRGAGARGRERGQGRAAAVDLLRHDSGTPEIRRGAVRAARLCHPAFTYYTVGPSINAPLDLFGGNKRRLEEQSAYNEYRAHELNAAYLSLTANVAAQALAVASAGAQIGVIQDIIADDQRNVDLVQTALDNGSATRTQLLTAQSQLATDRTLLPELRQEVSTARHALAILVGKQPAEWTPPDITLNDFVLPGEIPASLPSQLVHRRPDILAAEAQLHAASAAIGVATANLYPNVNLTGTVGQQALTPGGLFDGVALAWSLAANLTQPIYNGGRLKAERRSAIDGYQASLADYRQVVLRSFGEVADRLQALSNDDDQFTSQAAAAQTAAAARDHGPP